jgi:hypothetical protein
MGRLLPMNLQYDWGNKHPASSYVRVPTQRGVLTHSHNGRRWHQSEINHVNLFWKLATPWYKYEKWPSINAEKDFGSTMFHYWIWKKEKVPKVLRCHTSYASGCLSLIHSPENTWMFSGHFEMIPHMAMSQNPGTPKFIWDWWTIIPGKLINIGNLTHLYANGRSLGSNLWRYVSTIF